VIVLDTNVISELTRAVPDVNVLSWLDALPATEIATTAVTAAELRYSVERLPTGRRKNQLAAALQALLTEDLGGRIEPFDEAAAEYYPVVVIGRERLGRPVSAADAQIAAICCARGAILATRNTKDFQDTGTELVDPWQHR
jgi:predicted nucleic acid-binding protein